MDSPTPGTAPPGPGSEGSRASRTFPASPPCPAVVTVVGFGSRCRMRRIDRKETVKKNAPTTTAIGAVRSDTSARPSAGPPICAADLLPSSELLSCPTDRVSPVVRERPGRPRRRTPWVRRRGRRPGSRPAPPPARSPQAPSICALANGPPTRRRTARRGGSVSAGPRGARPELSGVGVQRHTASWGSVTWLACAPSSDALWPAQP